MTIHASRGEGADYVDRTPGERRAWGDGYRLGRRRGYIDAWQHFTGQTIPGADPVPWPPGEPPGGPPSLVEPSTVVDGPIGWAGLFSMISNLFRRNQ